MKSQTNHNMMSELKSYLYIFKLVFVVLFVGCKHNEAVKIHAEAKNNSKDYFELIESAEKAILDNEYRIALDFYLKSEDSVEHILGVDCYNALVASIHIKDWNLAKHWAIKMVRKGVNMKFFEQESLEEFKLSELWSEFEGEYENNHKLFLESFNSELLLNLEVLVEKDQFVYCQIPIENDYSLSTTFNEQTLENQFLSLLENRELFYEEEIGLNLISDKEFTISPMYYPLVRHAYQNGEVSIINYLQSAVDRVIIKKEFKSEVELEPFSINFYTKIDGEFYKIKNLDVPEIYKKKIRYNHFSQDKFYLFYAPYNQLALSTENDKKIILDVMEQVDFD